jgi:serine phosphatase RsbU (regulator of sigma subunit)/anti-sigma regulatory factor (Ser/Thr protein kinase)/PAS domain-containing protein
VTRASDAIDSAQGVISAQEALTFLDEASAILAGSLDYEFTLGTIAQLMVPVLADWCAVDVVQEDGSLRQITSGHPDPEQERLLMELRRRYRAEKGGSEGVTRVIATGEPELMTDVSGGTAGARLAIRDDETAAYDRLGPKSYLIVPMVARGRAIGAITLLSTRAGRHYGPSDLAFAQHLARRFALAVDNASLYEAAERSRSQLDNVFTTAPVGLAFLDSELRYVRVNAALAEINAVAIEDHIGRRVSEVLGRDGAGIETMLAHVLETGRPALDLEMSTEVGEPPVPRHVVASFTPITGADGKSVGISGVVIDVTERRRGLALVREMTARAGFLAEAGVVLDASLDFERVLSDLAQLAVPEFADWCTVAVLDEDGRLRQMAIAHADPAKRRWAEELSERYPPDQDSDVGVGKVLATGLPDVVNDVTDDLLEAAAVDAEHLRILRELGLCAAVTVPLVARGRTLGTISFLSAESGRRYEDDDVALFAELGRRAGVAIENARLYTERSRIAHTLQARLLPSRLPAPPGMRLAARYRAAGEYNEVGGDFYDAFQRAPGEWVVLIGDVSGKGPEAAALTALARYTIRAAALNDWAPAHVLRRLNETLLHEEESQFVTVALAYLSHDGQHVKVRVVLGGHPHPVVLRNDGSTELIGVPGTLLGIRSDVRLHEVETRLEPGDAMILYTDGVTEAGPRRTPLGEDGLAELLASHAGADPETLVSAIDTAAFEAGPGRARDDVAIIALQAVPVAVSTDQLELTRPARAAELRGLRNAVVDFARDLPGIDLEDVRLAVGEACANVVVHAYRDGAEGEIHLRALVADQGLVVEVRDDGCGPGPRNDSPGLGLGLPMMSQLVRELQVLGREPTGTLVRMWF